MPRFDLERVAEAARQGNVKLEGPRARDVLTGYIPTFQGCLRFAAEVAQCLTSGDFFETLQLARDTADVFGVELPAELLERHGLGEHCATWYVKLTLEEDEDSGDLLIFISLHPLEQPMHGFVPSTARGRKSGLLEPSW